MLRIIPSLGAQVQYTLEHHSSGLVNLADYVRSSPMYPTSHSSIVKIEATGNKGRSDDCSTLRNAALDYIPRIKDLPNIDRTVKKEQCGFSHYMTAHLLCPRQLRDEFDADMEGFCCSVQSSSFIITHDNWPSFLYLEDKYDPDAIDKHLLQGGFLLSVRNSYLFIYALTLFLVFSTCLHRTVHRFEGYTREGDRKKAPGRFVPDDRSKTRKYCICRSLGAPLSCFIRLFIFM
jgi:hypothetical protein